jgi:hypothetical protein
MQICAAHHAILGLAEAKYRQPFHGAAWRL